MKASVQPTAGGKQQPGSRDPTKRQQAKSVGIGRRSISKAGSRRNSNYGGGWVVPPSKHPVFLYFRDPLLEKEYLSNRAKKNVGPIRNTVILNMFFFVPVAAFFTLVSALGGLSPLVPGLLGIGILVFGGTIPLGMVLKGGQFALEHVETLALLAVLSFSYGFLGLWAVPTLAKMKLGQNVLGFFEAIYGSAPPCHDDTLHFLRSDMPGFSSNISYANVSTHSYGPGRKMCLVEDAPSLPFPQVITIMYEPFHSYGIEGTSYYYETFVKVWFFLAFAAVLLLRMRLVHVLVSLLPVGVVLHGTYIFARSPMGIPDNSIIMFYLPHFEFLICAILLAATPHTLERKDRELFLYTRNITSSLERVRDERNEVRMEVANLRQKLTAAQQAMVEKVLNVTQNPELRAYEVDGNEIKLERRIGAGAFGEVWEASYRDKAVAVKRLLASIVDEKHAKKFREEALLMAKLQGLTRGKNGERVLKSHDNLLPMLHCCWREEILIVLPFYELGSMAAVLDNETKNDEVLLRWDDERGTLTRWALEIASGMEFLHEWKEEDGREAPILHRDLKPDNVLIDGGENEEPPNAIWSARICDFGESKEINNHTMTAVGTPLYAAPEILTGLKCKVAIRCRARLSTPPLLSRGRALFACIPLLQ